MDITNIKNKRVAVALLCTSFFAISAEEDRIKSFQDNILQLNRFKVSEDIRSSFYDVVGEKINLDKGIVSLNQDDVVIPGNNGLDVKVSRIYRGTGLSYNQAQDLGDWQLGIPNISSTVIEDVGLQGYGAWSKGIPCSGSYNPGYRDAGWTAFVASDFWSGDTVDIPGVLNQKLLERNDGTPGRYLQNWKVECVAGDEIEGFKLTSPAGVKYTFDNYKKIKHKRPLNKSGEQGTYRSVDKFSVFLNVSRIEDRFGNFVNYLYNNGRLVKIISSDSREINLTYEQGMQAKRIKDITADSKQWRYVYRTHPTLDILSEVILPDNRKWQYTLGLNPTSVGGDTKSKGSA